MSIGTVSPATFEWIIPRYREALQKRYFFRSTEFHLPDSSWQMLIFIEQKEWINIYLVRVDFGSPKTITYTIKIYGRTGVQEIKNTYQFRHKEAFKGGRIMLEKESASDYLMITCYINCHTSNPVTGKKFVTSAVQTEVQNSVIEKENSKDDDWSSLDLKGVAVLTERMKNLLIKGGDHDVTICVQDKEFRAHRNILSARSPVFAMMLAHDSKEKNTGTINIEDCDPESFDEFLLYVYSGRTENLTPSNALQLYYPADKYDFPVLKEQCVNILKSSLSVESICDVVLLAAKHQEKELLDMAAEFFARNMKEILVTVGWQKFMPQNPVEANELLIKSTKILHP